MKRVSISVSTREEFNFFKRFINPMVALEWEVTFLTQIPSIDLQLKLYGHCKTFLFKIPKGENAKRIIHNNLERINKVKKIDLFFLWNGNNELAEKVRSFAIHNNINVLYFELANIPGKLFVDPIGVNAESLLYKNVNELDKFKVMHDEYLEWKAKYLKKKSEINIPPQVKIKFKFNTWYLYDYLIFKVTHRESFWDYRITFKILAFIEKFYKFSIKYDKACFGEKYVFFPLQLNNDSQLTINSEISNLEALNSAIDLANNLGISLLVKLHPAENDINYLRKIESMRKTNKFSLVNDDTLELILKSQQVITINSTVGLEAMILQKDVTFLGRTFYAKLDQELLKKYLLRYLINIDPFAKDELEIETVQSVISKIGTDLK